MERCGALTLTGAPCKSRVPEGQDPPRCWIHRGPTCSVCFGSLATASANRTLPCNHVFHSRCVDRWKRSCTGPDPTCPMCRLPFDVPSYRCRLIVERVPADSNSIITDFVTSNISNIMEGFGIDFRSIAPDGGRMVADIQFDIEAHEDLNEVLRELGLPTPLGFD